MKWTRSRGTAPTHGDSSRLAQGGVWGQRELSSGSFATALVVALVIHSPLAPSTLGSYLFPSWGAHPDTPPNDDPITLPIELDLFADGESSPPPSPRNEAHLDREAGAEDELGLEDDESDDGLGDGRKRAKRNEQEPAASASAATPEPPASAMPSPSATASASPSTSASALPPASSAPLPSPSAEPSASAAPSASVAPLPSASAAPSVLPSAEPSADPTAPPPRAPVDDPRRVAGAASSIEAKHPNVRVYIASDVARRHALGPLFGELLGMLPQWKELIGGTSLDPVRDFDHVLISGPHMKSASVVVAVVEYNVATAKVRAALDSAMKKSRPRGRWQKDAELPTATFGDNGAHVAAIHPDKRLLVVLPAAAKAELARVRDMQSFKKSGQDMIVLHIATPWRGVMNTGMNFPKSIKWVRLRLTPLGDKFTLDVEAEDANPESAERTLRELASAVEELRPNPLPGASLLGLPPLFARPTYTREGRKIRAHVDTTLVEMRRIMNFIGAWQEIASKAPPKQR